MERLNLYQIQLQNVKIKTMEPR